MGDLVLQPEHYGIAADAWEQGATLVYRPLADELVRRSPEPLRGLRVLDVGAGTGVGSGALRRAGAEPIAVDFSHGMLHVDHDGRPPAAVGDVTALPIRDRACDAAYAAFVLNHLDDPQAGLAELRGRVVRRGGPIVADVFSAASQNDARDAIDRVALASGWAPPPWYVDLKANAIPLLASAATMRTTATNAGLADIEVREEAVDVGLTDPAHLVAYRFGQAQFAPFVAGLTATDRATLVADATDAAAAVMTPYRPIVVFLTARAG